MKPVKYKMFSLDPASKNKMLDLVGTHAGSVNHKYNRAQKLIVRWNNIESKMSRIIKRGNCNTLVSQMAYIILLVMKTGIRIGNAESASGYISTNKFGDYYNKEVKTYGAITLQVRHIKKNGGNIVLNFIGKKQIIVITTTNDKVLLKYYENMIKDKDKNDQFLDEAVTYTLINNFVKKYIGKKFSAKDLRTAKVNLMFIEETLYPYPKDDIKKAGVNKIVKEVFVRTAKRAGHTPTVCRSKYVSPDLLFNYKESMLVNF